jgi:hypothetical protein
MDKYGNIALMYAYGSNSIIPSLRATARVQTDPLGMLREEFQWGTGLPTSGLVKWGTSFTMAADGDPEEGRTFYGTGMFYGTGNAGKYLIRVARLRQGGDAIERQWVAEDTLCSQIEQCIQTIQLG